MALYTILTPVYSLIGRTCHWPRKQVHSYHQYEKLYRTHFATSIDLLMYVTDFECKCASEARNQY
jgi:hypothetical protein